MRSRAIAYVALAACSWAALVACQAPDPLSPVDRLQGAEETYDDVSCVETYRDAGRPAVDACRAKVHAAWSAYWRVALGDGGAEGGAR